MKQLTEYEYHDAILKSVEANNLDMVLQLLSSHQFLVNHSAIEYASRNGFTGCLKALINTNGLQYPYHIGALEIAAKNGHINCLKILIPLFDSSYNNNYSLTNAAENGHFECVEILIPVSNMSNSDCTALEAAASGGHIDCLTLLLEHSTLEQRNFALRSALLEGNERCAELLSVDSDVELTLKELNLEHFDVSERWTNFETRWCNKMLLGAIGQINNAEDARKKM